MLSHRHRILSLALTLALTPAVSAVVQKQPGERVGFREPSLDIRAVYEPAAAVAGPALLDDLAVLGVGPEAAYLDLRSGRWGTLMPARPLIPGDGVGNDLTWEAVAGAAPASDGDLRNAAWDAFVRYVEDHRAQLRIDPAELTPQGKVTAHDNGRLVQIYAPRVHRGVAVRDSALTAVIGHGNLVLFGAVKWGEITTSVEPAITAAEAFDALSAELDEPIVLTRKAAYLELVPTAIGETAAEVVLGGGYGHRLVWVLSPDLRGDGARWEALVDAHSGEVLALQDLNQYVVPTARQVKGGVYPVSNDGIAPDGVEQPGWPMPWADVTAGGETGFTDGGGNLLACVDGTISTSLAGRFMLMNDNCGAINENSTGDLDLGVSGGTDCVVPPGHSAGDTHASRSGFFELNQVKAQARGQLPANAWPQAQLQANMNIVSSCNAFWDGSTVNFYRSGGGCANTGELAGVYDHEWGHGMDNNDAVPAISNPGEGVADIYAALRLNTSCMGRNFLPGNCNGYGDPCTQCSGVRDIDWANRASGMPHTITGIGGTVGIDALCGSGNATPCGGITHCEGAVYAEAVWDLFARDLPAAGFDHVTAIELAARLSYTGGGNVGNWFTCTANFGGCNADGGYLNYLAADDDDGNLANGTPHMQTIFNAFNRHEIACNTPAVQNSGCAAGPGSAPSIVSVTGIDRGALVEFNGVAGATRYDIFRTDGVFACDQGKIKVGSVAGPADGAGFGFADEGLQNGRQYFYTVIAVGASDACTSPASTCTAVTPVSGPNLALDTPAATFSELLGDEDGFLDNCEEISVEFDVNHIGTGAQTNVRIVSIEPLSHPSSIVTTPLPSTIAGNLPSCGSATASFSFQPRDMAFNDEFVVAVGLTSDQLGGIVKTGTVAIAFAESDLGPVGNQTFTFETDTDGWVVEQGTFNRSSSGGGANGTTWYEQSSSFLDQQCDKIRSPLMAASPTSTLSLFNNFDIEPLSGGTWYDRANIGFVDIAGERTLLTPDGGRLYNADSSGPGTYSGCNEPEEGWADSFPSWAASTWSAAAFGQVAPAGLAQLEVIYSTDPALSGSGFRFDEVTVTDVSLQIEDAQSDACMAPSLIFADGFEAGDTGAWSTTVP